MNRQIQKDMQSNLKMVVKDHRAILSFVKKANKISKIKTVYIAGKVSGLPYDEVCEKFSNCEKLLEAWGYVVINPCKLIKQNEDWDLAMKLCLNLLQFADHITLLPDWADSKGARMEKEHADLLGVSFLSLDLLG